MSSEPVIRDDLDWAVEGDDPLAGVAEPDDLVSLESELDGYDDPLDDPFLRTESGPHDREPVLLIWPRVAFEQVDQRWPELLEPLGTDSWDDYRRHYQRLIDRWASRGQPLSMVVGTADGFAEWLSEQGADPITVDLLAMADEYGGHLSDQMGALELPPAASDPCWCGSAVSYQQCCPVLVRDNRP